MPTTGDLTAHTTAWVPRPGIQAPYTLGLIRLTEDVLVLAHVRGLDDVIGPPHPVRIVFPASAAEPVPFWFTSLSEGG
jgi:uncharacterized OB-fold protein